MTIGAVLGFWGTSFLLVMTPGADWAYMINAGLRRRSIAAATFGLLVGYFALTAVVAAGVAAVVAQTPVVLLDVLTAAGAAYLIWLGVNGLAHPATPDATDDPSSPALSRTTTQSAWVAQTLTGAGISGLNPKALLLFLALLPQFTATGTAWPLAAQIMTLGLVHILSCAVVYTSVGIGARVVLSTRPTLARAVSRFSAAAMITSALSSSCTSSTPSRSKPEALALHVAQMDLAWSAHQQIRTFTRPLRLCSSGDVEGVRDVIGEREAVADPGADGDGASVLERAACCSERCPCRNDSGEVEYVPVWSVEPVRDGR